jgi:hypothetical protein
MTVTAAPAANTSAASLWNWAVLIVGNPFEGRE